MQITLRFLLLITVAIALEEYRQVKTRFGEIRGRKVTSYGNQTGFSFTGIPLAKPPIGELRFQEALDPLPWSGVLDVLQYRNACISDPKKTYKVASGGPVSEDCLYINVFASRSCLDQGGCSVMAVIHGGAMLFESTVLFKPETNINNFANEERNVVLVTIPFRVGTLGWFNPAPGLKTSAHTNIGLRDCIFGLKWIQREIEAFGGDPRRVTVFGHSAGGFMVQELTMSPLTEGLFHQFVAMSPPAYGGDRSKTGNSRYSQKICRKLGCADEDDKFDTLERVEEIIDCVRQITDKQILAAQFDMFHEVEEIYGTWIDGPGGVLPEYTRDLMKNPRSLRCLVGSVSAEMRDTAFAADKNGFPIPDRLEGICTHMAYEKNYERPESFKKACLKYYGRVNMTQFIDDDLMYYYSNALFLNQMTQKADCFMYSFEYSGIGKAYKLGKEKNLRPSHAEDYMYILGLHRVDEFFTEKDRRIERIYSGMMANFVNSGDPSYGNQKWRKWDSKRRNYFKIDFDEELRMPGMREQYYTEAFNFWNKTAFEAGGDWQPLLDFPKEMDVYIAKEVVDSMVSVWLNRSVYLDKDDEMAFKTYEIWTKHLDHLVKARKGSVIDLRAANTTNPPIPESSGGINWLTLSLVIVIVILVVYIAAVKIASWRKRKDYSLILN